MSQLTLLIGRKGSGKSTTFCGMAQALTRPSVIIDPGQAKVYSEAGIGFIKPEEIRFFRGEPKIVRISNIINKKQLVAQLFGFDLERGKIHKSRAFRNGNLFMEDAASYINSNMTETLRECIKSFKQFGLNLFLSYHSIDEISPDILRLSPDKCIFKKTGDSEKVFSKISKTKSFANYQGAMEAFYQAQFFGLTPDEILKQTRPFLPSIAKDLYYTTSLQSLDKEKAFCKHLSKLANGRQHPTPEQKEMSKYMPFAVDLRL